MSDITEKQAKSFLDLMSGAKIIIPFIFMIISVAGVWYDGRNQINIMQKDINTAYALAVKNEAKIQTLQITIENQRVTLTEVTTDLKYIKDAQKETLELVRKLGRIN